MYTTNRTYVYPNGSYATPTGQLAYSSQPPDSSSRPSSYARDKTDDLCEECGMWPKVLTAEGFRHPFCSKTCAKKYRHAITTVTPPSPTQDLCLGCGLRPKSTADGYQYPHCSRSCARQWPLLAQDCALPGCKVPITGAFGGYCSTAHSDQARRPNVLHKPRQPVAGPSSAQPHRLLAPVELRHYSRSAPTSPVNRILFYDKNARYYGFTNFSYHPVTYRGNTYPTSEHLFQSFKFLDHRPDIADHIRTCSDRPSVAFSEARRYHQDIRHDWHKIKIEKMDTTLYHKFTQHPSLQAELLGTGDAELVEDSPVDPFWGVGCDGKGRNELGKALMRLRRELRSKL